MYSMEVRKICINTRSERRLHVGCVFKVTFVLLHLENYSRN